MNPSYYPTFPAEAARLAEKNGGSYWIDMAGEIDTPAEILAEELGLSAKQGAQLIEWLAKRSTETARRDNADELSRAFSVNIPKDGKINAEHVGLQFVALYWLLNQTGESLTSLASRVGVSKQLLDWHAKKQSQRNNFRGVQQKRASASKVYSESARARFAAMTPEQRRQHRAGKGNTPPPKLDNLASLRLAYFNQIKQQK